MSNKIENMKLSTQAMGAIMMALQESLMNQMDIVPILQNFDLTMTQDGLIVNNPPTVRVSDSSEITEQDLAKMVK